MAPLPVSVSVPVPEFHRSKRRLGHGTDGLSTRIPVSLGDDPLDFRSVQFDPFGDKVG